MASEIDIPVAMTAAIDDLWQLSLTSFDYAQRLKKSPHASFFLSPGGHCAQGGWDKFQYAGKTNDSKASLVKAWFDHWLKGRDNGVASLPKFNVFPEGAETWTVQSSAIPAEQTQFTRFYLNSDGKLLESAPAAAQQTLVCLPCAPSVSEPSLVFDAPILDEAMTLAGAVSGFLNIDADRADSAFSVGLFFVDADGTENLISDAQIRARDRALDEENSLYDEYGQLLHPRHKLTVEERQVIDGVYRYPLSFMPAAHRIPAGSFIRLRVAFHESKYVLPFDLQTSMLGTTLTLHTGGGLASEIILPVIPSLE
jgi:predicted acyl esterase